MNLVNTYAYLRVPAHMEPLPDIGFDLVLPHIQAWSPETMAAESALVTCSERFDSQVRHLTGSGDPVALAFNPTGPQTCSIGLSDACDASNVDVHRSRIGRRCRHLYHVSTGRLQGRGDNF
jgi:hypothetical protein